jgi:16S rRNA (guanine966-N2)-methyltransferase
MKAIRERAEALAAAAKESRAAAAAKAAGGPPRGAPAQVRIIGGQWKRSMLPVAHKPGLRPTPDRVRETLFNWLGNELDGWRVVDAYAGSGALGFEAASRGAAAVLLLEQDAGLVRSLGESKTRLKAEAIRVQRTDALSWLKSAPMASFELVLIDPPFDSELALPSLEAAAKLVVPGGFVYLETGAELKEAPAGLQLHRHMKAGTVHAHLLRAASLEKPA